ncbi:anti-sigma factor [Salinactinospora qingdaonensis]|uniref:Regulator of SigK n=1 Tax=Salinactinospora qingdaonensis TaxID=702744 RepID=A0ABP7F2C0_9ACTN
MTASDHTVHGLTAGYAVDALEPDERDRAERHLRECEDCRRDLNEFRETTVRLAYGVAEPPDERVWRGLRSAVADIRQLPPEPDTAGDGAAKQGAAGEQAASRGTVHSLRAGRWHSHLPWLVAAACLAVAITLGGVTAWTQHRMNELRAHTTEVEHLLAAADARMTEAPVTDSDAHATVVTSETHDSVMLMVKGLPEPPEGMAYQMWYVDADHEMRSAGMLKPADDGMLTGMAGELGTATQIGITLEPAGGMPEPSKDPMKVDV